MVIFPLEITFMPDFITHKLLLYITLVEPETDMKEKMLNCGKVVCDVVMSRDTSHVSVLENFREPSPRIMCVRLYSR